MKNALRIRSRSGAVPRRSASTGQSGASLPGAIVKRALLAALCALLLLALLRGAHTLRDAAVGDVQVFGHSGSSASVQGIGETEVLQLLEQHLQRGFWQLDLPAVQAALEAHAWVRRAEVRREWPDTLRVQIDEHLPVARWNAEHILASSGELIRVRSLVEFASLPQIATPGLGAHSREEIIALVDQYNRLQKMLAPQGLSIRELGSSMGSDIWLVIDGETRIELGSRDHLGRLARLVDLVESGVIANWESIAHADMRYASGLAVRWRSAALGYLDIKVQRVGECHA